MTTDEVRFLASPEGERLLKAAAEIDGNSLKKQSVLRRDYSGDRVRAALTLVDLRERAKTKFRYADRMFFDRDGLEQASGDAIADHRARRYAAFDHVADLCCGVGGDTIGLSARTRVTSVDIRPERVRMTRENATACGFEGRFVCTDVRRWCPSVDAVFIDPSRREGGRRVLNLSSYAPPVDDLAWLPKNPAVGIKVAPGINHESVPENCEIEFISVGGECREAVLWFGALRSSARVRATVLPNGASIDGEGDEPVGCGPISDFIYEPDRAVIRAHLVDQVARSLDAVKLAPDVAYLTADRWTESPFARGFRVDAVLPFSIKRVQAYVSDQAIGRLDIKKRRFPMTPEAVFGKLKLKGSAHATLILTRVDEAPMAVFCQPVR